jgi:hypothetical protein
MKGKIGVFGANSGSFKKGQVPKTKRPIGSVRIRKDKNGKPRAWVKIADNGNVADWKLRAVVVWESVHGVLPSGMLVHHEDRNTLNDDPSNLNSLDRSAHITEHQNELEQARRLSGMYNRMQT